MKVVETMHIPAMKPTTQAMHRKTQKSKNSTESYGEAKLTQINHQKDHNSHGKLEQCENVDFADDEEKESELGQEHLELVDHDERVVEVLHDERVLFAGLVRVDHHDGHDEQFEEALQQLDEHVVARVLVNVLLGPPRKLWMLSFSFSPVSFSSNSWISSIFSIWSNSSPSDFSVSISSKNLFRKLRLFLMYSKISSFWFRKTMKVKKKMMFMGISDKMIYV